MHFHLPKPLHGWREFAGEVGIIVIGVLIALAAEQVVENLHNRAQVHHAIDDLRVEGMANRGALDADVIGLQRSQASVDTDLAALGDCGAASNPGRLVPVVQSLYLFPSAHVWSGVRDSALLPLMPAEMSDRYYKLNTFELLMEPGMNELYASRALAGSRVEAMRRGIHDQELCHDAVVQLLHLRIEQDVFLKDTVALRAFNQEALRNEEIDAVARPDGLNVPTSAPSGT